MSRISYSEEEDYPGQHSLWQANCRRSLAGRAGQAALRDLVAAMTTLPEKRLVARRLSKDGDVCAVGAVVLHRKAGEAERVLAESTGATAGGPSEWMT